MIFHRLETRELVPLDMETNTFTTIVLIILVLHSITFRQRKRRGYHLALVEKYNLVDLEAKGRRLS